MVMQFLITKRHEVHNSRRRPCGPGHDANPLADSESAGPAEGDGRREKVLNLRLTTVNDLPNLVFTRFWFAHDMNAVRLIQR